MNDVPDRPFASDTPGHRVTPAEVMEAYRATGYRPIRGAWGPARYETADGGSCTEACPLTTLAKARDPSWLIPFLDDEDAGLVLGLDTPYVVGFTAAWDGQYPPKSDPYEAHRLGHLDGLAARAAFAEAGIEVPYRDIWDDDDDDDDFNDLDDDN